MRASGEGCMDLDRSWDMLSRACPCHALRVLHDSPCSSVPAPAQHSTAQHSTAQHSTAQRLQDTNPLQMVAQ